MGGPCSVGLNITPEVSEASRPAQGLAIHEIKINKDY